MYYSEELTTEVVNKIQRNEDVRAYKIGPNNRIVFVRRCAHCQSEFYPSRINHKYCSASCRVRACYDRNKYEYSSGHYKKTNLINVENKVPLKPEDSSEKAKGFDWKNAGESAVAMAAVETVKYLAYGQKVMNILNSIKNTVEGKANSFGGLKYLGIRYFNNISFAVFKNQDGTYLLNDANGIWYQQNAGTANELQIVLPPF